MIRVNSVDEVINPLLIQPGSVIYISGNAATPQVLLEQLGLDHSIKNVDTYGVLWLGERIRAAVHRERCSTLTHRIIFNSYITREAVNKGWAYYHPIHLSEIPRYIKSAIKPNVVMLQVNGPDRGGNYSLGTTVEGVLEAIFTCHKNGGIVIAECNAKMPFVLGTTFPRA